MREGKQHSKMMTCHVVINFIGEKIEEFTVPSFLSFDSCRGSSMWWSLRNASKRKWKVLKRAHDQFDVVAAAQPSHHSNWRFSVCREEAERGHRKPGSSGPFAQEGRASWQASWLRQIQSSEEDLSRPERAPQRLGWGLRLWSHPQQHSRASCSLYGLWSSVLSRTFRLPTRKHHPQVEWLRFQEELASSSRATPSDQQLPRVHRTCLPSSMRGCLHPWNRFACRDYQVDWVCHHWLCIHAGMDEASQAGVQHWQANCHHWIWTVWSRSCCPTHQGRTHGCGLRAQEPRRRTFEVIK